MANAINWFEIPAADFDRAVKFYGTILQADLPISTMDGTQMGFLPGDAKSGDVSGAVCYGEWYQPSEKGAFVYLNGGADLSDILSRVSDAGGNVVVPKTQITEEIGYFAMFMDTEGNRVGLHSPG